MLSLIIPISLRPSFFRPALPRVRVSISNSLGSYFKSSRTAEWTDGRRAGADSQSDSLRPDSLFSPAFMSTPWLPDGDSQILRLYEFGPSLLKDYGSTTLRCKIRSLPFLGFSPPPSNPAQSKERKGSNFAIRQHCGL